MNTEEFLAVEARFHNRYASTLDWDHPLSGSMSYEEHSSSPLQVSFRTFLGDPAGRRILDVGSGHGNCALELARRGGEVTGIDISPACVEGCRHRADSLGLSVDFRVMNACELEFGDGTFDAVVSFRSLHHLPDLMGFFCEAHRVLRLGGFLLAVEPQKHNPFVQFGRKFIANKDTDRTPTEHPLVPADLRLLKQVFGNLETREFEFLAASSAFFARVVKLPFVYRVSFGVLNVADRALWHLPFLRPLYWQTLLKATKTGTQCGSGVK